MHGTFNGMSVNVDSTKPVQSLGYRQDHPLTCITHEEGLMEVTTPGCTALEVTGTPPCRCVLQHHVSKLAQELVNRHELRRVDLTAAGPGELARM